MNHSDGDEAMNKIVIPPIITLSTANMKGVVSKPKWGCSNPD
jgi:hypothetical protein